MRNKDMFKTDVRKKILCLCFTLVFLSSDFALSQASRAEQLWTEKKQQTNGKEMVLSDSLFRRLAETLSPAVVNIQILHKVTTSTYREFPFRPPSKGRPPSPDEFEEVSGGSGFIIHKDGYILTNAHVVADSEDMQVSLSDGKLFKGKVIGTDTLTDIALVKIDAPKALPVLPLGSSEKLKPGDWVMAIGSPFGLDQTVTVGIVSAKGRSLGTSPFDDFIQTDASINPGNSGGPLINTRGEVVGINAAILAEGQGLGFSLPIDLVKIIVPPLKEKGQFIRSWMGVVVQEITLMLKESLKLKVDSGSLVSEVVPGSPAEKAGIRRADVIIEFNGFPIKNSRQLPTRVAHSRAGVPIPVKIVRDNKTLELKVKLEETPKTTE